MRREDELVEKARTADPGAIGSVYRRYAPDLYRIAVRITASHTDAEDIVHDVFVGLPKALESLTEVDRLEAWIRKLTVNRALTLLRHRQSLREAPIPDDIDACVDVEAASVATIAAVHALAMLPEHLRVVVVMKELEGYSHEEISEMLGISVTNSTVRLHRAKRQLRAWLVGET